MILLAIALAAAQPGYPPGDARCTLAYQIETGWEFWADDRPNCPVLRALFEGNGELADRKIRLAIERINSCDMGDQP